MTEHIDISKEALKNEGNIWINENTKQIRYSVDKNNPAEWIVPMSIYQVGNDAEDENAFIKAGQPVSIGYIDELKDSLKLISDPCVVPTNPTKHQWCIGIAGEPGNAENIGEYAHNYVHILSRGQYTYKLNDTRPNVFSPPKKDGKFVWTYSDIGKPVYISNNTEDWPDQNNPQVGGLTLDITHAYFDGANIVSIGRLANAPSGENDPAQEITIEIQPSGDVRGFIDSTQFAIDMSEVPSNVQYTTDNDRIVFVKVTPDKNGNPIGQFITNDEMMISTISNTPLGGVILKPKDGTIDLNEYAGKTVVVQRLGILEGNFSFVPEDLGKELFLSNGNATTAGAANAYEYKVGVVLDTNRVIIDCRFPKTFATFNMVGDIKPAYANKDSNGEVVADAGFVLTEPNIVHKVSGAWSGDTKYPTIDFEPLIKTTMYKGIYLYHEPLADLNAAPDLTSQGWREITGNDTFNSISAGWFQFKDVYYKIDNNEVITQIKYNQEGAPEDMSYIWPSATYTLMINNVGDTIAGGIVGSSNLRINISQLVALGQYMDDNGKNIESYYIEVREADTNQIISPGFKSYYDKVFKNGQNMFYGYEWAIQTEGNQTFLEMVTIPSTKSGVEVYSRECVLGFTFPEGKKPVTPLELKVFVRRRATQYHNLFLNQLNANYPWAPHTDGNNLVTEDTVYFGEMTKNPVQNQNDNIWDLAINTASLMSLKTQPPEIIGDPDNNPTKKYWKSHEFGLAPHNIGNGNTEPIYKLVQRYTALDWNPDAVEQRQITWIYDFESNSVSLDAEFAPKLLAPTTQGDKLLDDGTTQYGVINHGTYNKTSENVDYEVERSALKTLHEIPTSFFNYYSDLDRNIKKIGPIQDNFNYDENNPDLFKNHNYVRQIFPPLKDGTQAPGTTYTYLSDSSILDETKQNEWEHILQEIGFIYHPITRDASGNVISGGDLLSYTSNLGLLNQAAKETQDRLLKLERAIFGANAPTLPDGTVGRLDNQEKYKDYQDCLVDGGGILRQMQALLDFSVIENRSADENYTTAYDSAFYQMYLCLFGKYDNLAEWANLEGVDENNYNHKFHLVYIWWKETQSNFLTKIRNNHTANINGPNTNEIPLIVSDGGWQSAAISFMSRPNSGDLFDGNQRKAYEWPLDRGDNWKGPYTPYLRWWSSNSFGVSDDILVEEDGVEVWKRTYASSTVEGVLTDVMLKLSHIKRVFEPYSRGIKPESSLFYHYPFFDLIRKNNEYEIDFNETNTFISNKVLEKLKTKNAMLKFGDSAEVGEYSAFGFKNDKIDTGYSLSVCEREAPDNFTNPDRNYQGFVYLEGEYSAADSLNYWGEILFSYTQEQKEAIKNINIEYTNEFIAFISPYAEAAYAEIINSENNPYKGEAYNGKYNAVIDAKSLSPLIDELNNEPIMKQGFGFLSFKDSFSTDCRDWRSASKEEGRGEDVTGEEVKFLRETSNKTDSDTFSFFEHLFQTASLNKWFISGNGDDYIDDLERIKNRDGGKTNDNDVFVRYRKEAPGIEPLDSGQNGSVNINEHLKTTISENNKSDGRPLASLKIDFGDSIKRRDDINKDNIDSEKIVVDEDLFYQQGCTFLTSVDLKMEENSGDDNAVKLENPKYYYNFVGISEVKSKQPVQEEPYIFSGFASVDMTKFPDLIFSRKITSQNGTVSVESVIAQTDSTFDTATTNPIVESTYKYGNILEVSVRWNVVNGVLSSISAIIYFKNVQPTSQGFDLPNVLVSKRGVLTTLSPVAGQNITNNVATDYNYSSPGGIAATVNMTIGDSIVINRFNITSAKFDQDTGVDGGKSYSLKLDTASDYINEIIPLFELKKDRLNIEASNIENETGTLLKFTTEKVEPDDPSKDENYLSFKDEIKDYRLHGINLPEKPDVLIKLKSRKHIANQIHLACSDIAKSYPKVINYKIGNSSNKNPSDTYDFKTYKDVSSTVLVHGGIPNGQQFYYYGAQTSSNGVHQITTYNKKGIVSGDALNFVTGGGEGTVNGIIIPAISTNAEESIDSANLDLLEETCGFVRFATYADSSTNPNEAISYNDTAGDELEKSRNNVD